MPKKKPKQGFVQRFLSKVKDVKTSALTGFRLSTVDVGSLREGIRDSRTVSFVYTRRDGNTLYYSGVEPYEIKGGYFWGYHKRHNSIHKFVLANISNVKTNNVGFEPRKFGQE